MELSILASNNLPEGTVLSIRSGTVRRQAPLSSSKAFKFPLPTANPLKFDLFTPLASGHLVTREGQEQYQVNFMEGSMSCEVQVKPSSEPEPAKLPVDEPVKKESAALGAKDFLEKHKILDFVQAALHAIITERPADPYTEMARHLMCGYKAFAEQDQPSQRSPSSQEPVETAAAVPEEEDKASAEQCSDPPASQQRPVETPVAAPKEALETLPDALTDSDAPVEVSVAAPVAAPVAASATASSAAFVVAPGPEKTPAGTPPAETLVASAVAPGPENMAAEPSPALPTTAPVVAPSADNSAVEKPSAEPKDILNHAHALVKGEEAICQSNGLSGQVLERTTTDILLRHSDGTEAWHEVEDVGHCAAVPETTHADSMQAETVLAPIAASGTEHIAAETPAVSMLAFVVASRAENTAAEHVLAESKSILMHANATVNGEEAVCRSSGQCGVVLARTTTDVLLRHSDGTDAWHEVEDVGQRALWAAPHNVGKGESVTLLASGAAKGTVVDRTTTEVLVRMEDGTETWHAVEDMAPQGTVIDRTTTEVLVQMQDGTEAWHAVEDVAQLLPQAHAVKEGDQVIRLSDAQKGTVVCRTTTDVLLRMADGSEKWHGVEKVARGLGVNSATPPRISATQDLESDESWATKLRAASKEECQDTIAGLTANEHQKLKKALDAHTLAAPGTVPEIVSTDGLRVMMKDVLLAATETGELQSSLEGVLSAPAVPTEEDLRAKMMTCIVNANETGQLASLLEMVVAPKDTATDLPLRMATALDAALVSGELAESISKVSA